MPANRKPRDQLQDRRPERLRGVESVDRPVVSPEPDPGWLPATCERWDTFWRSELATATIDVDRETVVHRLFHYYDQWDRLRDIFDSDPVVEGSTGQPRMNPAGDQLHRIEGHIQRLEQTLGIGPLARHRLGLTVGQARMTALELNRLAMEGGHDET